MWRMGTGRFEVASFDPDVQSWKNRGGGKRFSRANNVIGTTPFLHYRAGSVAERS
jgi:hypothetical protein